MANSMAVQTNRSNVSATLRASQVSLTFAERRPILEDVSFEVASGEFLCIVGASGCGKTSLLRLFSGLLAPTKGSVFCDDAQIERARRDIAIIFQDYGRALLPWRTVSQNVALALEARGIPARKQGSIIEDLLQQVGLSERNNAYPLQLSGGMQQRLQIARCLAQEPRVMLMDEPFGALDAMTRQNLQDAVADIASKKRTTVLFVTHDLEEAIYLGDRVICMESHPGRIGKIFKVDLPRPRSQLTTRESKEFLKLRHELFQLFENR